jgi:hypothetical protein
MSKSVTLREAIEILKKKKADKPKKAEKDDK